MQVEYTARDSMYEDVRQLLALPYLPAEKISRTFHRIRWNSSAFAELHDLALCRLTLFNGHHGNEAARLRVADWEDAKKGIWVNPARLEQLSKVEQQLFPCTGPKITALPVSLPGLARPVYYEKSQDPARPGPSTYWAQPSPAR